ncbi:unnamed protein product [Discosporangium mesarthrocarpum]
MRDYTSYGALRKTGLMVVAYNLAPEKLKDLRTEFTSFDKEKNGTISRSELAMALQERGVEKEEMDRLFESIDVDNSGKIHYLEFLAATIEAVGTLEEERLRMAFERLDTDGSGFITVGNFKEMCGPVYDDEAVRIALEEADLAKNGRVDWEEFKILMRGGPERSLEEEYKAVHKLKDSMLDGSSPLPARAFKEASMVENGQGGGVALGEDDPIDANTPTGQGLPSLGGGGEGADTDRNAVGPDGNGDAGGREGSRGIGDGEQPEGVKVTI